MRKLVFILAACLLMAVSAAAQGTLTGIWQGNTNGGAAITLDLTAKGTTLTGTLSRNDDKVPISDGVVTGNAFTFKAVLNDQAETVAGELDGDQLKAWLERQGRESAITLTRGKPQPQK